jgi:purine-nucleoside phosphorylase
MMQRPVHISPQDLLKSMQFKEGDFAKIAILSGQPQRVAMALEKLKNPVRNFSAFGYTFWTGDYWGKRVTIGNGGLYAPDAALVTELLCVGGIDYLIRLGSCGGMRDDIKIGDYVLAENALRGEGVTRYYVSDGFTPHADETLGNKLAELFIKVHRGMVWTTDALLRETKELVNNAISQGAIAVDMVTSAFLTITQIYKKKAAALLMVSDNLITGEVGFSNIRVFDAEKRMIDSAFDLIGAIDE